MESLPSSSQPAPSTIKVVASATISLAQTLFHWGFVPTVIYLGFRKGADAGTCARLLLLSYGTSLTSCANCCLSCGLGMPPLTWEHLLWK